MTKRKSGSKRRLTWALDPFTQTRSAILKTGKMVRHFTAGTRTEIEPVFIISPVGINWTGDFTPPLPKEFTDIARRKIETIIQSLDLKGLLPPTILTNFSYSLRKDVGLLLSHAQKSGSSGIVLNTHSRRGLVRLFVGSFTNEMLLRSTLPLLVVNPRLRRVGPIRNILYPTDLSDSSKQVLKQVTRLAKRNNAKITLFYKIPEVINPYLQSGVILAGGGWVNIEAFMRDEYDRSRKEIEAWASMVKRAGVEVDYRIEQSPASVADEILQFSDKNPYDLICMNSKVGPVSSFLIGSVAREVVQRASSPVWVVHSS